MTDEARDPHDGTPPPAAPLIAGAAHAETAARARLPLVLGDLFRAEAGLSDYQRATVLRMIGHLFDEIETSLRGHVAVALPERSAARVALEARDPLGLALLEAAGLTRDGDLVTLMMARANEHRLAASCRPGDMTADPVMALTRGADEDIAAAAADLLAAQGRRFDRFREPVLPLVDLPDDLARRLVWRTAAGLRHWLILHGAMSGERALALIAPAAEALIAASSSRPGTEGCAAALIDMLATRGRLDDGLIGALGEAASLPALAAALARLAEVPGPHARDMLFSAERLALLLRAAGVGRAAAGALLLRLSPDAEDRVVSLIAGWDEVEVAAAHEALRPWRLDPAYRDAVASLGGPPA